MINAYKIVIGKPGKSRRSRHRQDDNIKIDLKGMRCKSVEICSGWDPVAHIFEHENEFLIP